MMRTFKNLVLAISLLSASPWGVWAQQQSLLVGVPDYNWDYGCFGTACGNLLGYWDRHGLGDFYTGPTGGGVAPLDSSGPNAGIRSLWASQAGFDGRPSDRPGHLDDYWNPTGGTGNWGYESTAPDPYVTAGRTEHTPDCIGDFIGLNQKKWTNMNGECDGNINGFSFVYWDLRGSKRLNYVPSAVAGSPARDIQSGLRAWAKSRGYEADVFTQLTDFNPHVLSGKGFSFVDLKAEIDAGCPVLLFLQDFNESYRSFSEPPAMSRANPEIHGMLAYGYEEDAAFGVQWVYYRTSWASGDGYYSQWNAGVWQAGMPLRGVIGFHPKPKIRSATRNSGSITLRWDGPSSQINSNGVVIPVHSYQVQRSASLTPPVWQPVGSPTTDRALTVPDEGGETAFFRIRLLRPGESP